MARHARSISAPVGTRNGVTPMPNLPGDLAITTDLFDRIPVAQGGSAELGGVWATDRSALIAEVTAQIVAFQTTNRRPVIDGVIDPGGGTLKLMNQLAADPGPGSITARVVDSPAGYPEEVGPVGIFVADPVSMFGTGPITPTVVNTSYSRRLVRVEGSSISWFGVVVADGMIGAVPHINFTPTPNQGGYAESNYDSFAGWEKLWADYTSVIGGQVAATGADQVVVLPFYRTSQAWSEAPGLGEFLDNWREVIRLVVEVAVNSVNPYRLNGPYSFDRIVSSSFSNGYLAHRQFNGGAAGAADMTDTVIDLDGQAGGSHWRPQNGIIYLNKPPGKAGNPDGHLWYVGGRWGSGWPPLYGGALNTHAACRNHLLYHAVVMTCS